MKTLICLTAAATLLCGCNQKPDPRIAQFDARLSAIETNIAQLAARADGLEKTQANIIATANHVVELQASFQTNAQSVADWVGQLQDRLLKMEKSLPRK